MILYQRIIVGGSKTISQRSYSRFPTAIAILKSLVSRECLFYEEKKPVWSGPYICLSRMDKTATPAKKVLT